MTQEREDDMMGTRDTKAELEEILTRAKKCNTKGRLYVYEAFKKELQSLNLDPVEYCDACRELSRYLEV